ncbi:DUF309 domain-containing protein [Mesorhizobium sp. M1156]|uniref:DUF309 domain-containing protein n=1 Tax=Mesorhizobium sp. M1156 TaxID=2957064 RepID=UPI00333567D0
MKIDLINHGYYWEAHEAWEPLWHAAKQSPQHRLFLQGLILLAAAGVKIREGKRVAAARHAARAGALFRQVALLPSRLFEAALGITLAALAVDAEAATTFPTFLREPCLASCLTPFSISFSPKSESS